MTREEFSKKLDDIGLKKAEFAEKLGLAYSTVNNWGSSSEFPRWVESWLGNYEIAIKKTGGISQKQNNFFPYSLDINAVPTIISALKKELNQITEIISADIYEQNLSLREIQTSDKEVSDFYIPDVGILDEIIDLYKQKREATKEGISEIQAKELALKIQTLKLDYQRSAKHEYKIDALLRHWTSIIEQEFENGII